MSVQGALEAISKLLHKCQSMTNDLKPDAWTTAMRYTPS